MLAATQAELRVFGLPDAALSYLAAPDWGQVERDLAWLVQPRNHLVTLQDGDYPRLLQEIHEAPPVLFVHGEREVLAMAQLAIVGTRHPTAGGRQIARDFAHFLADAGLVITSGLALGIDAEAHRGALAASAGRTIAVLGTGTDRVYPAEHRELAHAIAERGALVSEFTPGTPALAEHFPRRNRIISGMTLGVLVVEAALKSGSLITARLAADQGREVFAIPGSIHNPLARGCHGLIREGAKLVETAADIIDELGPLATVALSPLRKDAAPKATVGVDDSRPVLAPEYQDLLAQLSAAPVAIDELVERSGLTVEVVSSMLLILELQGFVAAAPGGLYTRLNPRALE